MPDIIDIVQQEIERGLAKSLKNIAKTPAPFSGACLACGEAVAERRFCNADSRAFYDNDMRPRLIIRGRIPHR